MLEYAQGQHGKSQQGYFSRGGWSGYHLWKLLERAENPEEPCAWPSLQRESLLKAAAITRRVAANLLAAKAGRSPESQQARDLASAAVGADLCTLELTKVAEGLVQAPADDSEDLNLKPIGRCDRCDRKVWKANCLGEIDEAQLSGGGICGGRFVPL